MLLVSLLALHVLGAVLWVGGMAFSYLVLRPAAAALEPPIRLSLWVHVFELFLPMVWASIVALLLSGYAMLFLHFGGFAGAGIHIHVMHGLGIIMTLLFLHLYFVPWRRLRAAVERGALPEAAKSINQMRLILLTNLILGILTVVIGATGRYW